MYLPVYSAVHCDHYESRYPEADRTRNDSIRFVCFEQAFAGTTAL